LTETSTTNNNRPDSQAIRELKDQLLELIKANFAVRDTSQYEIVLAAATAHYVPGEPVWLRIYGPSRSGKTEILRAILEHPDATGLEVVTPAAIRGGLKGGHRVLERINGKLVITKDLAALSSAKSEARREVLGLLRNVKDGNLSSDFGTEAGGDSHLDQSATFDWILATTDEGVQNRQVEDALGARFIDLRWMSGDRADAARRAAKNNPRLCGIRDEIAHKLCEIMDAVKSRQSLEPVAIRVIPGISQLADIAAHARTPVARTYGNRIKYIPQPELGTELAQGLHRIAAGLELIGVREPLPYIARLARDSIPFSRVLLLGALLSEPRSLQGLAQDLKVAASTLQMELEDLQVLGLVDKSRSCWHLRSEVKEGVAFLMSFDFEHLH
jgi:hypothetical protein